MSALPQHRLRFGISPIGQKEDSCGSSKITRDCGEGRSFKLSPLPRTALPLVVMIVLDAGSIMAIRPGWHRLERRLAIPVTSRLDQPHDGLVEMTNENGNNGLPYDDPAFKWAWEIYKEADHLVHSRTTFFFAAQSFLVVAYSTFAVSRFNWKENQSIYIIAMAIIVFTGIIFSLILWELNYTVPKE